MINGKLKKKEVKKVENIILEEEGKLFKMIIICKRKQIEDLEILINIKVIKKRFDEDGNVVELIQ